MYDLPEQPDAAPETYDCERCGAVVNVAKHGRRRLAALKAWVCSKCFPAVMSPLTAEAERNIAAREAKSQPTKEAA